jgi:hypothetical protein
MRQVGAAAVDEIDAGQPVLLRDLLRPQMLFHRQRIVGAALDGRVVADDHALAARYAPDARDESGAMYVAAVYIVGRELRQLQERRSRIDKAQHAVARQQLAAGNVALPQLVGSARRGGGALGFQIRHQRTHGRAIGCELLGLRVDSGRQLGHGQAGFLAFGT